MLTSVPAGFVVNYTQQGAVINFAVNFIAILPTLLLLSYATSELDIRVGKNLGELINVTFR